MLGMFARSYVIKQKNKSHYLPPVCLHLTQPGFAWTNILLLLNIANNTTLQTKYEI